MQRIIKKYKLREEVNAQHQTYALGIKEVNNFILVIVITWIHVWIYKNFGMIVVISFFFFCDFQIE